MKDYSQEPEFIEYAKRVLEDMVPKMKDSAVVMSLVPRGGVADVKFAVELGYAVWLNKPIIALAVPGDEVPEGLRRVAHKVIFADPKDPKGQKILKEALSEVMDDIKRDGETEG